jgi:hypothetical protein
MNTFQRIVGCRKYNQDYIQVTVHDVCPGKFFFGLRSTEVYSCAKLFIQVQKYVKFVSRKFQDFMCFLGFFFISGASRYLPFKPYTYALFSLITSTTQ